MKKIAVLVFLLLLVVYAVRVASRTPERLRRCVFCACWMYGIASAALGLVASLDSPGGCRRVGPPSGVVDSVADRLGCFVSGDGF